MSKINKRHSDFRKLIWNSNDTQRNCTHEKTSSPKITHLSENRSPCYYTSVIPHPSFSGTVSSSSTWSTEAMSATGTSCSPPTRYHGMIFP